MADSAALRPTGEFTIELWEKGEASDRTLVAKPYVTGSAWSYRLSVSGGHARVSIQTTAGSYAATSSTAVDDGEWHQLAGSWDGSTLRIYVDGASEGSAGTSGSIVYSGSGVNIGRADATDADGASVDLDEVALYAGALGETRILAHYLAGSDPTGAEPSVRTLRGRPMSSTRRPGLMSGRRCG